MKKILFLLGTGFLTSAVQAQLPQMTANKTVVLKGATLNKVTTSAYSVFKNNTKTELARQKPAFTKNVVVLSQPTEVVDVSNTAKYPVDEKTAYPQTAINTGCNALPVNYKSSQQELGLFFPSRNFKDAIFPGAIYRFGSIREQSPLNYTRFTNRNPMDMTTDIFDASVTNNAPVVISQFDYGTISSQWKNILARYIGGATPADVITEIILVESNEQMNTDLKTAGNVDVGTKITVPIPDIPVSVDASNKVSVTNTSAVSGSSENKKNSVILRFRQVFYSATMSPKAGAQMDIFRDVDKTGLESDLVYVHSVDYGQMFYVVITSEYTKESLYNAVMNKVTTQSQLGVSATGLPVGGSVSVGTSNQTTSETASIFSSGKTTIKTYQYGGEPVILGTTLDEVLAGLKTKIKTRFDGNNLGAPISYTLNFVADHTPAWVNTNISYATANCGVDLATRKYDIKLKLVKLDAPKVIDTDNNEDLFGALSAKFKAPGINLDFPYVWHKSGNNYDEFEPSNASGVTKAYTGTFSNLNLTKQLANGISNDDVKAATVFISGYLKDKEVFTDIDYVCQECHGSPRELKLSDYIDQINAMQPGETRDLKMSGDHLCELNFYENGDHNSSHVTVYWAIEITAR